MTGMVLLAGCQHSIVTALPKVLDIALCSFLSGNMISIDLNFSLWLCGALGTDREDRGHGGAWGVCPEA